MSLVEGARERIRANGRALLPALFVVLNTVVVFPALTPNLTNVGAFDEPGYIQNGRTLSLRTLPALDQSPVTTVFYALVTLPVRTSDFWLVHSCTIGRFLCFLLLWSSAYRLASRVSHIASPVVMAGLLLISPALTLLFRNASHALFVALSSLALAAIVGFGAGRETRNLGAASLWVGLAALTRLGEGTFVLASFVVAALVLGAQARRIGAALAAAVLPAAALVGGYMLLYLAVTGRSPLGDRRYLYAAFEQGHGMAYESKFTGLNIWVEGEVEARRLFGSPDENHHSVAAAIRRNPAAYVARVPRLVKQAVYAAMTGFGGPASIWLFALAGIGGLELMRRRQWTLLTILALWPSYLLLYVLLVFQPPHLVFPFPVLFVLAAIGATAVVCLAKRPQYLCSAALLAIIAAGVGRKVSLDLLASSAALLVALWIVWMGAGRRRELSAPAAIAFLLGAMLLFRESRFKEDLGPAHLRTLGAAPDERAMLFLRRNFTAGSSVGAYAPKVPWAANMNAIRLHKGTGEMRSARDLRRWLLDNNIQAIYVDQYLRELEPAHWRLIENEVGRTVETAFAEGNPRVEVLRVARLSDATIR
jgi:MYXO-CTERM domain-containing protein